MSSLQQARLCCLHHAGRPLRSGLLSSAEKWRRVVWRMSFKTCSAGFLVFEDLAVILVRSSCDETKTFVKSQP